MNEKLPAPCDPCKGTGLLQGSECEQCHGKGYRLMVNGAPVSTRPERPKRWQNSPPNWR